MKLRSFRTTNFKTIHDSGPVTVEPRITCLVGKNESGKTAVEESLYRLRPTPSAHPGDFDALRDYPRRFYGRDKDEVEAREVVRARFELTAVQLKAIDRRFGTGVLTSPFVEVAVTYGNDVRLEVTIDEDALVRPLASDEPPLDDGPRARLESWLLSRVPSFIYFSNYDTLPGSVSVRRLKTVAPDDLEPGERTALSLLRLAGVDSEEFTERDYEARKAALEAAANALTDEVFDYWSQNRDLQVDLDIEFRPSSEPGGAAEPFLQIRIRNTRHRVTLNFAQRSAGFVWFFSFLAYFSEFRDRDKEHILLLDEPGLNLHGTAQADLLRYVDEQLADNHQVIYSTHSPFMVQAEHLERARLVEDNDREGTVVTDDARGTSEETQFPLNAAIGIEITHSLVVGPTTLVVEGNADLLYLRAMSRLLQRRGGTSLSESWTILPVGGLDKMPTFVALFASQAHVVVLHDGRQSRSPRLDDLVRRRIVYADQLVSLAQVLGGVDEADVEDLLDVQLYLRLLRDSGTLDVDEDRLSASGRVVERIEAAYGSYSQYSPAMHFAAHPERYADEVGDATAARFDALFASLNDLAMV